MTFVTLLRGYNEATDEHNQIVKRGVFVKLRPRFNVFLRWLRHYAWGSPSLVSTIEELLEGKSSGSGLEGREYGSSDQSR
jgi:hypothetical protein